MYSIPPHMGEQTKRPDAPNDQDMEDGRALQNKMAHLGKGGEGEGEGKGKGGLSFGVLSIQ